MEQFSKNYENISLELIFEELTFRSPLIMIF